MDKHSRSGTENAGRVLALADMIEGGRNDCGYINVQVAGGKFQRELVAELRRLTTLRADAGGVVWRDEGMARHWIDRYAGGIDDEPQMDRILDCITAPAARDAGVPEDRSYFNQHAEAWANAIYNDLCAADNQDVPLEECAARIVAALARAGYAVVPADLPPAVLGETALGPFMEQGNPRHLWDFLLAKTRAYFPTLATAPPQPE